MYVKQLLSKCHSFFFFMHFRLILICQINATGIDSAEENKAGNLVEFVFCTCVDEKFQPRDKTF